MELPNVDLIISDLNMPIMDGFEFITAVRESGKGADTNIIVLTAGDDDKLVARGEELGVLAWIIKPMDEEELMIGIEEIFS